MVLSFRGTESFKDAITDAKAMLEKLPDGGRVHTGFLKGYRLVEKEILSSLVPYKDMPLYITGHSLGGGLSILATRFLSDDNLAATYTFGCPRVADQKFLDYIYTPVYRIVNSSDIVTRVPFGYGLTLEISLIKLMSFDITNIVAERLRGWFCGYTHKGNFIYINSPSNLNKVIVKASPNYFRVVCNFLKNLVLDWKSLGNDHRMEEYIKKLNIYAENRLKHRESNRALK